MAIQNAYLQGVYEGLAKRNPEQKEFLQAVEEVLESLEPVVEAHPEYEKALCLSLLLLVCAIRSLRMTKRNSRHYCNSDGCF